MHLKYSMYDASYGHPQTIMENLGIKYTHATSFTLYECWLFWNCTNVPEVLPKFLEEIKISPTEIIGDGLSKAQAEAIIKAGKS